jgi:hypothetical protein
MRENRVVVQLDGGLGNQLFQYAHALSVARQKGASIFLDIQTLQRRNRDVTPRDFSLGAFQIEINQPPKHWAWLLQILWIFSRRRKRRDVFNQIFSKSLVELRTESNFSYRNYPQLGAYTTCLKGYWQSPKYFESVKGELQKMLQLKNVMSAESETLLAEIRAQQSLCVNVRRGDYTSDVGKAVHGLMGTDYYRNGTELIKLRSRIDRIYIFSDEPEWCRKNLALDPLQVIVGHEHAGLHFSSYLHLMASCKFFVIPNSTFGWWAAWLADAHSLQVVAPSNWFANPAIETDDLIPKSWTRIVG